MILILLAIACAIGALSALTHSGTDYWKRW